MLQRMEIDMMFLITDEILRVIPTKGRTQKSVENAITDFFGDCNRAKKLYKRARISDAAYADFIENDLENPYFVALLAKEAKREGLDKESEVLETFLKEFKKLETKVSREEIKEVYIKLKERKENPKGTFDSQGRFYLRDSELVNVRSPSTKYPYSQMNAGRTAAFVKAIAEKYKCQTLEELESVAFD